MERKTPARAVTVEYTCDSCGEGEMIQTGLLKPVNPPLYEHKCNKCGAQVLLPQAYPSVQFEKVVTLVPDTQEVAQNG